MYEITYNRTVQSDGDGASEGTVNTTGNPAPTFVNVTGLITGSGYTFAVRAINSIGGGALSEGSEEVSTQLLLWLLPHRLLVRPLIGTEGSSTPARLHERARVLSPSHTRGWGGN